MVPSRIHRRIVVPEEGYRSPLFLALDASDVVEVTVLFRTALTEALLDEAERAVLGWFAGAEWGGRLPILVDETLNSSCLYVAVTGVRSAQRALGLLLQTLDAMQIPIARVVLTRLRADGDRDALVRGMDPGARPQVEYDDPRDWWRACFDPEAPPPLSEDRADLARDTNALLEIDRTTYAEHRGLPLHLSELRICYGLADVVLDGSGDARASDVARALDAALAERLCGGQADAPRPAFYGHAREPGAPLDRIRAGGKNGYSCALQASDLREFLHNHLFRYREYELMLAVRDAIRALDLEPVVCWRRFRGRYVLQIWERGASQAHRAA